MVSLTGEFMVLRNDCLSSLLKGLLLIASLLLLLAFANASTSYNLNYNIYPETNELTLQQGTGYTVNVFYKLNSTQELPFVFDAFSTYGIYLHVVPKLSAYRDFTVPLYIKVGNVLPGKYNVILSTKVLYGGIVQEKQTTIVVNVIQREKIVFQTSNYTNALPELKLLNISTRNLYLDSGETTTVMFKFTNTGSTSDFTMNDFIDSSDKNKIQIQYQDKYFRLEQNEVKNILVNITVDKNYAINYTPIYFYADEQSTSNTLDLGQINLTLKTQDILVAYTKDTNTLEIKNIGSDFASVEVNSNLRNLTFMLQPSQTYFLQTNDKETDVNVFLNDNLYKTISLQDTNNNLDQNKPSFNFSKSMAGLFSFGSGSVGWIIVLIVFVLLILLVRKLFFARNAVFGKNIYVKDLNLKQD